MPIIVDGFDLRAQKPIDDRFVKDTVEEALTTIPSGQRYIGLTVFIKQEKCDYIFRDGILNSDFVRKIEAASYTYIQYEASDTWTIHHYLNKHPSITVSDSAGNVVWGDYNYVDDNTIICKFLSPFAGKAFLN